MKIIALLLPLILTAVPAWAGPKDCPDGIPQRGLTAEGAVKEYGSADGFYLDLDLTPQTTGDPVILPLSVQDTDNTVAVKALKPGDRVRVTYDMVREFNETDGECIVYGVLRSVESQRPQGAGKRPQFD